MAFQFELMDLDSPQSDAEGGGDHSPLNPRAWKVTEFKDIVRRWQVFKRDEGFWNAYVPQFPPSHTRPILFLHSVFIQNHDHARCVSRFGNDTTPELRTLSAKMLAILETTLSGTLYMYQGEELGMVNFPRSWGIEEYKDVASVNYYNKWVLILYHSHSYISPCLSLSSSILIC
jgi:oligo-1,6-glucosidase